MSDDQSHSPENLTLTCSTAINGVDSALCNVLSGNNTLAGDEADIGGAGNDTLTGNSTTLSDVYRWGIGQRNDTINDAGSANRIEEIRLADGSVIGGGAAPLSMAGPEPMAERMFRLTDPWLLEVAAEQAAMAHRAQSLVQAMAQFDAHGVDGGSAWQAWARHDPLPMLTVPML